MAGFPKGFLWNQLQLKIAQLVYQNVSDQEIIKQTGCSSNMVWKVKDHLKKGDIPPDVSDEAIAKAPPPMSFQEFNKKGTGKNNLMKKEPLKEPIESKIETPTEEENQKPKAATAKEKMEKPVVVKEAPVSQLSFLKLVPQSQQIALTPAIFTSYLCAIKNGFNGDIGDWLSLCALDFWSGRGRDCFAEVSGINLPPNYPEQLSQGSDGDGQNEDTEEVLIGSSG